MTNPSEDAGAAIPQTESDFQTGANPGNSPAPDWEENEALKRAAKAARDKKPVEMVEALYESHVIDGLIRTTQDRWSAFSFQDAEDVVAQAIDALYTKVAGGSPVSGVVSFLRKVAHNKAFDLSQEKRKVVLLLPVDLEAAVNKLGAQVAITDCGEPPANHKPEPEPLDWEQRKRIALAAARNLLPRLGQENIRRVMAYIFDAVEAGQEDIASRDIADALGLTNDTARQARHRGFERLERIAKAEKLMDQDFNLAALAGEAAQQEADQQE